MPVHSIVPASPVGAYGARFRTGASLLLSSVGGDGCILLAGPEAPTLDNERKLMSKVTPTKESTAQSKENLRDAILDGLKLLIEAGQAPLKEPGEEAQSPKANQAPNSAARMRE